MIDAINNKIQTNTFLKIIFSHFVFTMTYMCVIFMYDINFLRDFIDIFHPIFTLWASLIGFNTIFISRKWELVSGNKLLFIFMIISFFSAIVNYKFGIVSVLWNWLLICMPLIGVYPLMFITKNKNKIFAKLSFVFVILTFVSSLISNFMYMINFGYEIYSTVKPHAGGVVPYYNADGSASVVLFGVYMDSNRASIYALVSIAFSCFLLYMKNKKDFSIKKPINIFLILNILTQICYFPLANSRGGYISLIISIISIVCFCFIPRISKTVGREKIINIILMPIVAIVLVFVSYQGFMLIRTVQSNIATSIVKIENAGGTDLNEENFDEVDKFEKENATEGILGLRGKYWVEAFELFTVKPILGTASLDGIKKTAQENNIGVYLQNGKYIHNAYIELLVCTGILGFATYIIFLVLSFVNIVKRNSRLKENYILFYCVLFALASLMCQAMLLGTLFVVTTIMYLLMLISLAYLLPKSQVKKGEINE